MSFFCGLNKEDDERLKGPHLPPPTGYYTVGIVDIMIEGENECFFRLYYPSEKDTIRLHKHEWPLWLPQREYADGYAHFLNKTTFLFGKLFQWIGGDVRVPGYWNSPLLEGDSHIPVIVFSHGIGGNRTCCSKICCELASYGFVVAAPEHRDGSASVAYLLKRSKSDVCLENKMRETHHDTPKSPNVREEWLWYDKTHLWDDFDNRNKQLYHRANECINVLNILESFNSGDPVNNMVDIPFDASQFKGRLDIDKVSMVGHSFGGTSCICVLSLDTRFKLAVSMDAWFHPVDDKIYESSIEQPILFINSDSFHWQKNIEQMSQMLENNGETRSVITVKGTCHQSTTDFQFMMRRHLAKVLQVRDSLEPAVAIDLHVKAILAFIRLHLDLPGERFDDILQGRHEHVIAGYHAKRKDPSSPKKKSNKLTREMSPEPQNMMRQS